MNIQQAQDELYQLSEEWGVLMDRIKILDTEAAAIVDKRRMLLHRFPVLDLRRIGDRPRTMWSKNEIEYWGEGVTYGDTG